MSLSPTQHSLDKLEDLLTALGFKIRYEKGNFKTASCLLDKNKIIVINKFSNVESRIIALHDLVVQIRADESLLEEKQKQFLFNLKQITLPF